MLSLHPEYKKLSEDAKLRLDIFYNRYCQGKLGKHYGVGHLIYACHASFPLMLSAELANLLWINFKNYYYTGSNDSAQVHQMAVIDFLQSTLCREVGWNRYEVYPEIRSFLLMLLNEGSVFGTYGIKKEGKKRLEELAWFLREYLQKKVPEGKYENASFRQMNEWAVLAWLKPGQLAVEVAKAFQASDEPKNYKAQLWLSTQMEKVNMQYEQEVVGSEDKREMDPFYQVFYYARARNHDLKNRLGETVYEEARKIKNFPGIAGAENEIRVKLPLMSTVAERTEREINETQRVFALFVGVEEEREVNFAATRPVFATIDRIAKLFAKKAAASDTTLVVSTLINEEATARQIASTLEQMFEKANDDDIVFFFFTGNANLGEKNELICGTGDQETDRSANKFSNEDFSRIRRKYRNKTRSVIMLDTSTGYYDWGNQENIFIGATNGMYQSRGTIWEGDSAFLHYIFKILEGAEHSYTYKDLFLLCKHQITVLSNDPLEKLPVMRVPKSVATNYVLSKKSLSATQFPLISFDPVHTAWQVVEEDFLVLRPNGGSKAYDYELNPVNDNSGEIFLNREFNFIQFGGRTDMLNNEKIYRVDYKRETLGYRVISEDGHEFGVLAEAMKEHQNFEFDGFSNWGILAETVIMRLTDYVNSEPQSEIFITYDIPGKFYGVVLNYIANNTKEVDTRQIIARSLDDLLPAIKKLVRYNYLLNLTRPGDYNIKYDALNVYYHWRWQDMPGTTHTSEHIVITDENLIISKGSILLPFLIMEIQNDEDFPVFYNFYLMASDCTIKLFGGNKVNANSHAVTTLEELVLFDRTLMGEISLDLKFLVSRDPITIDFSQIP